jgi:1,4-dihydroxy-2-naphthoyl-CoA synthase
MAFETVVYQIGLVNEVVPAADLIKRDARLCAGTEDKKEGTQAFLQKRPAQFQAR